MSVSDDGSQRAAEFFRRRGLDRVVAAARDAYWRNSGIAGSIVLDDATTDEHSGLAALSGRAIRHGALRVKLSDLDDWLQQSGFACSLESALAAYAGDVPRTRAEERARTEREAALARERRQYLLEAISAEFPSESGGRRWLTEGAHGIPWLLRRYQATSDESFSEKRALVRTVATALSRLPLANPRRLAVFANEVAGNPHAFDPDQEAGRLLTLALLDLHGVAAEIDVSGGDRLAAADRRALFEHVGLLGETISSIVAVYNLGSITYRAGSTECHLVGQPLLQVLPLRSLVDCSVVRPSSPDSFIVENPVVFEDLIDSLESRGMGRAAPTLICTAGWLNLAAWRLLDLLAGASDSRYFFYSGDFDLAGLRIAGSLRTRYPDRFRPWRLTPDDYRVACRDEGTPASAEDLRLLSGLSTDFPDLVQSMLDVGQWAYQEAITPLLFADLDARGRQLPD